MSINYSMPIKNARLKIVSDEMKGGTLNIYTYGYENLLVSFELSEKSSSIEEGSLNILNTPLEGKANFKGTAALATIKNKDGEEVAYGLTVGTAFTDIIIDTIEIEQNQKVIIVSGTIIHG